MKDLDEFELIEIERRSRELLKCALEYRLDSIRTTWDRETREDKRYEMAEYAESVQRDVETLCDYIRAKVAR